MLGLPFLTIAIHCPVQTEPGGGGIGDVDSPSGQAVEQVNRHSLAQDFDRPSVGLDRLCGAIGSWTTTPDITGLVCHLFIEVQAQVIGQVGALQDSLCSTFHFRPVSGWSEVKLRQGRFGLRQPFLQPARCR